MAVGRRRTLRRSRLCKWRGWDSNPRPPAHEAGELTMLLYPDAPHPHPTGMGKWDSLRTQQQG